MSDKPEDSSAGDKPRGFDLASLASIHIEVGEHGVITLRRITVRDLSRVEELLRRIKDPREFTARLVHQQINEPQLGIEDVQRWSDNELSQVARSWATGERDFLGLDAEDNSDFFEKFRYFAEEAHQRRKAKFKRFENSAVRKTFDQLTRISRVGFDLAELHRRSSVAAFLDSPSRRAIEEASERQRLFASFPTSSWTSAVERAHKDVAFLTQSLRHLTEGVASSIRAFESIALPVVPQSLYASLPDLNSLIPQWRNFLDTLVIADETGFEFAAELIPEELLEGVADIDPRVRDAVITNKLSAQTRSDGFAQSLSDLSKTSLLLQKRMPIVQLAIQAHRRREYYLAIPAMLAQVEGLFTDLMILKGEARRRGKDVIAWVKGSGPKLGSTQKHIKLTGLKPKIEQSEFRKHPETEQIVDFLLEGVLASRNAILHGRDLKYGRAKFSVQMILLFTMFARVAEAAENGRLEL